MDSKINLIFDYDGTIHNCFKIYKPSFLKACEYLESHGKIEKKSYTDEQISYWLGFSGDDMWKMFQPNLEPEWREKGRKIIGHEMAEHLNNGDAELFENAEKVLSELKSKGYTLIFLSNCREIYQQRHTKNFGLNRFFDCFYPAETYNFIPKYEIFRQFIKSSHQGDFIVIGDRFHDIETAVKNNLKSVGCAYGYGNSDELKNADIIINSISELPEAVEKLATGHQ